MPKNRCGLDAAICAGHQHHQLILGGGIAIQPPGGQYEYDGQPAVFSDDGFTVLMPDTA